MIPSLPQIHKINNDLYPYYACLATRKFFFFLDPLKREHIPINKILQSPILSELFEMREETLADDDLISNWFSPVNFHRVYENYIYLDKDEDGLLSTSELAEYGSKTYSDVFMQRVFQEFHTFSGKLDFKNYLNFVLMIRYKQTPESIRHYFRLFDLEQKGCLTSLEVMYFLNSMLKKMPLVCPDNMGYVADDIRDEIFDLSRPLIPDKITVQDIIRCRSGDIIVGIMTDALRFYNYDQREYNAAANKETVEQLIPPPPPVYEDDNAQGNEEENEQGNGDGEGDGDDGDGENGNGKKTNNNSLNNTVHEGTNRLTVMSEGDIKGNGNKDEDDLTDLF